MTSGIYQKIRELPKSPGKFGEFEPGQDQRHPTLKNERMTISKKTMFERNNIFQTIMFGIHVKFWGCILYSSLRREPVFNLHGIHWLSVLTHSPRGKSYPTYHP